MQATQHGPHSMVSDYRPCQTCLRILESMLGMRQEKTFKLPRANDQADRLEDAGKGLGAIH